MTKDYFDTIYPHTQDDTWFRAGFFAEFVGSERIKSVLELGCSVGNNLVAMHRKYPQGLFVGIDSSKTAIEQALGRTEGIHYMLADITDPNTYNGFADSSFDLVFTAGVLIYIENIDTIVEQCKRISKNHIMHLEAHGKPGLLQRPGGKVIFYAHNFKKHYPKASVSKQETIGGVRPGHCDWFVWEGEKE